MQAPSHTLHPSPSLRLYGLSRLLLYLTIGLASAASAHTEYRVTIVGPANSYATDINQNGVVSGNVYVNNTSPRAFLNRGSGVVYLGTLGGTSSTAIAINNKGQVLGQWTTGAGQTRGFIYYAGALRDIGVIPGRSTRFTDINNNGFITAQGTVPDGASGPRSYLRSPSGAYADIGTLPFDTPIIYANALNDSNTIAGAVGPLTFPDQPLRAFTWSKGVMTDLGDFGWAPNYGAAISECGQITGSMSVLGDMRDRIAYLHSNGHMRNIDARPTGTARESAGAAINCRGHIVGSSDHLSGFIYRGRRMQSLNAMIDPAAGWDVFSPQAINDAGQIAANAMRKGVQYAVRLDLIRPSLERALVPESQAGAPSRAERASKL